MVNFSSIKNMIDVQNIYLDKMYTKKSWQFNHAITFKSKF